LTEATFLDKEVTDNGSPDKAKLFVRRGRKAAGLLKKRWPSCRRMTFGKFGFFISLDTVF
jgi:hypothetical protein